MIRINLSPEPQWLDLGHGVRLLLLPLTTALMVATRVDPAVQALDADASNDSRAAVFAAALATSPARMCTAVLINSIASYA